MTQYKVDIDPEVQEILDNMTAQDNQKVGVAIRFLEEYGPHVEMKTRGQYAHSLKNSRHAGLKELIVRAGKSVWRFAYYYIDKDQTAYILCGGDKRGKSETLFYKRLIDKADRKIDAIKRGE